MGDGKVGPITSSLASRLFGSCTWAIYSGHEDWVTKVYLSKSILDWYKRLTRLRASTPELRDGAFNQVDVVYDEDRRWLVMTRGPISMAMNLGKQKHRVPIPANGIAPHPDGIG